ncbi:MAG: AAC(3) family N-acetyltransferase [Chloroflexota bacterium]
MREVTQAQVVDCLVRLGIQPADGLLVHSAVQFLGKPVDGSGTERSRSVGMYLEAIQQVTGPQGTIAVPTFNFDFAQGAPYDPGTTPSKGMGAFSEYVRQHPQARRTSHPMQSLAIIGHYAGDLAGRDTLSAFDPGSAFERMLEIDFKLLLLGAHASAISMFHYCEHRANVPYRYWKDFPGQVRTPSGWQQRTYRMFVRNLDLNPQLTLDPVVAYMQARQEWRSLPLNYGTLTVCKLSDFVAAADKFLAEDPWSLVTNKADCLR